MRLISFHAKTFRNVIDSTEVAVDDVTCLVGKNEAGKSAILQALHALNPAKPDQPLTLLDEYPRWLKKEHEVTGEIESAVPISATFELTDEEVTEFTNRFDAIVLSSSQFTASRSYAKPNTIQIQASIDYQAFLSAFLGSLPQRVQKAVGSKLTTADELITALKGLVADQGSGDTEVATLATDAGEALQRLWSITGAENRGVKVAIDTALREALPRTFYFSTYSQLAGRYNLEEVIEAVTEGSADDSVQAAADFLRIARAVPESMEDADYEQSNSELEATSSLLTKRVREHWKQNDHLKLRVAIEAQPYTFQSHERIRRWLQFRVEDQRHDFSNRLDRRSTGFQWFVSFLASFLEFEADKNLILLLDEPGLSLHARAQMDLLDALEAKLARNRQVIYSTHSPFMVRSERLNQARVVEDRGPDFGTVVDNDAGAVSDPDTLFPLEAALGYDIAHNLFIGRRNVLVEGVSDFIYLTAISGHLTTNGRPGLPTDSRLIPAGGATNIPTFLALLGTHLDVVVLIDGNTSDQRIQNSIATGRVKDARILSVAKYCNVPGADIEDVFEPQEYLDLYNATYGKQIKLTTLKGKDRIVKRIARAESEFDHGEVAAHFLRNLDPSLVALSPGTLDRFESLIQAISAALPDDD
ncbi:ATP-dependent endonuclease [Aeromicrobium sp. CF4.19]|uniref:AAA family ATPase n=1 Tax=Aeromicrobium sp. CF4.19 TaxID=3373082 RepID=UPI003EE4DCF7